MNYQLFRSPLMIISGVLLGFSVYFFIGAEKTRAHLLKQQAGDFLTGDTVEIVAVIDGDEVSIEKDDGTRTVVRLLGLKSFARSGKDFQTGGYTKLSLDYLKSNALGKTAEVTIGMTKTDKRGRLLAFLDIAGKKDEPVTDLGLTLIKHGYGVVYTKYAFARESEYLEVEKQARKAKRGLWANANMVSRIFTFKSLWDEHRGENEAP